MRPEALVVLLALPVALAAASDEVPKADPAPQAPDFKVESPAPVPFDFRQDRNWPKYLGGPALFQYEAKPLNADAGTCYKIRILPVDPGIDSAMVKKTPNDYDPKMVLKTPPACEQKEAKASTEERKILLRRR